jgi:membrane protease YdiL (CAAX protease family)
MVIGIVPVLEELLFRGFLQGAFRRFFSVRTAILFSSFIFALFHFSLGQGVNNMTILVSLFILSLFLGFLKERQGNLWGSIAMHMTFNAISVAMILNQDL